MIANDVLLLRNRLAQTRAETADLLSEAEHAVYFVAKHYLASYQPSQDDLLGGIVDGTRDGGIDAVYVFVDGFCVRDDAELDRLAREPDVDLILLQVKDSPGFAETALQKLQVSLPQLLELDRDEKSLASLYNGRVLENTRRFLKVVRDAQMPKIRVWTCFAAMKADGDPHETVAIRSAELNKSLASLFPGGSFECAFLSAAGILELASAPAIRFKELRLAENPISTDMQGGYVGLVRLTDFEQFITDDYGRLEAGMFEANVRDYEGDSDVNRHIQSTLSSSDGSVDFWWLNNGITIVANRILLKSKRLELETPQIVNGLQTSHEIFKREAVGDEDSRSVLVKVVEATSSSVRDRIIQATNSQTSLASSALRATDHVQRQIEEHLLSQGYFYERRKNLYKNEQRPLERIISIERMAQAVVSTVGCMPHVSRGEISKIFGDNDLYKSLFSNVHPIGGYLGAIKIFISCESFLRADPGLRPETDNFVHHLAMMATIYKTKRVSPGMRDLDVCESPTPADLDLLLPVLQREFQRYGRIRGEVLLDRIAKSSLMTEQLFDRTKKEMAKRPPFRSDESYSR